MEYYSATKKEWNNVIYSNTDESRDYHPKGSKLEKDKYHIISLKAEYKIHTNELIYKETDSQTENNVWLPGGGTWGGVEWKVGVGRCKLLYIEWIKTRPYCTAQGTIIYSVSCDKL